MWKSIKVNDKQFFIHKSFENNELTMRLTDLVLMWKEVVAISVIRSRFQELNKSLPYETCDILSVSRANVMNQDEISISEKESRQFELIHSPQSYPGLKFIFILSVVSPSEFSCDITQPLLMMLHEMKARQSKLKMLLNDKDTEITEYRLQGAKLFRKYVKTKEFVDMEFTDNCNEEADNNFTELCQNSFGSVFSDEFNSLYAKALRASRKLSNESPELAMKNKEEKKFPQVPSSSLDQPTKWELQPQAAKRLKRNNPKLKL